MSPRLRALGIVSGCTALAAFPVLPQGLDERVVEAILKARGSGDPALLQSWVEGSLVLRPGTIRMGVVPLWRPLSIVNPLSPSVAPVPPLPCN